MVFSRTEVAAKSLLWLGHCFQPVHLRAVKQDDRPSAIAVRDATAQCTSGRSSRLLSSAPGAHLSTLHNRPVDQGSTDVPAARRCRRVPRQGVLPGRAGSVPHHIAISMAVTTPAALSIACQDGRTSQLEVPNRVSIPIGSTAPAASFKSSHRKCRALVPRVQYPRATLPIGH